MQTRRWTTKDKLAAWGPGPWENEPDKVQWTDKTTGLPCLAVRNHYGAWCGYVGVDESHPAYLMNYDSVDVSVHGGLTFADMCQEEAPEGHGVCHIPGPGEPDQVWWLGFDCGHFRDYMPAFYLEEPGKTIQAEMEAQYPELAHAGRALHETYRTLHYVMGKVRDLAKQLAAQGQAGPMSGVAEEAAAPS